MTEWLIVLFSICLTLGIAAWATETDWRRLVVELKVWWLDFKRAGEPDLMGDKLIDRMAQMAESQGEREPLKFRRR
jgi:hypothetical protein